MASALRQLLDTKLVGLDMYILERRDIGRSWRQIAADIRVATDIDVSDETLRNWYPVRAA